jgi:YfiH family protein
MSDVPIKAPIAISTINDGSMKKDDGSLNFANIERFIKKENLPTRFVCMGQVHSGDVAVASGDIQRILNVDGLVSITKNITLAVVTADCLPILFYDHVKEAIAVVHAGSKGLLKNIIHNTVETLERNFQTDPKDLTVIIGPSVERDCYEVDEVFAEKFKEQFPWFDNSFTKPSKPGHLFLDLRKTALHCLMKEGILKERITISEDCTKCSVETYYSYRRGDTNGRFVSVISLV